MENKEESVCVRLATPADGQAIKEFQIACAFETEQIKLNPRIVQRGVMFVLSLMYTDNPAIGSYLVVENSKKEIIACCLLQKNYSDWHAGFYLNIESVYIKPLYRGKDLLKLLYNYIERVSGNSGNVSQIRSTVAKTNIRMHKALSNIDWEETKYLVFAKNI